MPDLKESDHISQVGSGIVRPAIEFRRVGTKINIIIILYYIIFGVFQNVLEIDRYKNVFFDFTE
jgi:hypothetical protein